MKKKPLFALALTLAALAPLGAQVVTPASFTLDGYYNLKTNGNDTAYMRGLASRHVNGELRFLTLTHNGWLQEFRLASATPGGTITALTGQWNLGAIGATKDFTGFWFDEASARLFVTGTVDYTVVYTPAWVKTMTLGPNGQIANVHTIKLGNVPEKRMYGGCRAVPAAWRATIGGAIVCGFGGYTSLVDQGGGATMGPTMYAIPDPATIPEGGTVTAKVVLDVRVKNTRGTRATTPINYFDGGDPRQNPSTAPTAAPVAGAAWLSPDANGNNWFAWGDSYYGNAAFIDDTFVAVAAVCQGKCWYQSSTLEFDGRTQELHTWSLARLTGADVAARPDAMAELVLPRGYTTPFGGNTPASNVSGIVYDLPTRKLYVVIYPAGPDVFTGRLYRLSVGSGGTPIPIPTPSPTGPADAVVSDWTLAQAGPWSVCHEGGQTRTETWTRTILSPAQDDGSTPPLSEQRTGSQECGATPEVAGVCVSSPGALNVSSWPSRAEGTSTLRYSYAVPGTVTQVRSVTVDLSPLQVTVVDARGCSVTRIK